MFHVCVTIVNTNEKESLKICLDSLYKDTAGSGIDFCVVVADNASGDNIKEFEKIYPNLIVAEQKKNLGFGASHNNAIKRAEAKYYFILNPDTIFKENSRLIRYLFDFMENNPEAGMAGPKIIYPDGKTQYSCFRFPDFLHPLYSRTGLGKTETGKKVMNKFLMKDFSHEKTVPVDWIMGSAMFIRAEAIKEVGMFDERFWMYAEDSDWARRMWQKHWLVYYAHDKVLIHAYRRASAQVPGVLNALIKNKFARAHLVSWFKYFWKWRNDKVY